MDKLYWIVCEEKDTTQFEGRYQGRTRGAAMKHLKQSVGRKSLSGLVFTITEIPVPLIREIVAGLLAKHDGLGGDVPSTETQPVEEVPQSEAPSEAVESEPPPVEDTKRNSPDSKVGNPGHGDELWDQARAYWRKCRNLRETAQKFGLSPNTVKTRARRENWKGDKE